MAEVFVSYKRENVAVVGRLVEALRGEGVDVWWDLDIPPDAAWEQTIERELSKAALVIVAWSRAAVASENVKAEARWARGHSRLLQVFVEPCEPPLFFGERQGVDLKAWSGSASDRSFRRVLDAIRGAIGPGASSQPPALAATEPERSGRPPDEILAEGTVLNGIFEVRRLLGRGRVGAVYEGMNVTTRERVAIKAFRPDVAELPAVRAAILGEMNTLTRLTHPAIVPHRLAAREPASGALYIVNEFIDGIPLEALIGQVTLPEQQLRALVRRLAEGLKHAHDLGVVHRGLSPDNIIVPQGRLSDSRIIDFGISQEFDEEWVTAKPEALQAYLAPEQFGEFGGEVGPWTDVYSLGCMMLALATGVRPDIGRAPDVSQAPPTLQPLLAGMLAPDPATRLRSMDEVLAALDR